MCVYVCNVCVCCCRKGWDLYFKVFGCSNIDIKSQNENGICYFSNKMDLLLFVDCKPLSIANILQHDAL